METRQSGHSPRSRPEIEEVVPKMCAKRLKCGQSRRRWVRPCTAVDDHSRCKKNSAVLSCIDKRKKKAVTMVAKSKRFPAGETEKDQFLWGDRGNLAKENCESSNSSGVAGVF